MTTTGAGTLEVPDGATFSPRELRVFGPAALDLDTDATVQTLVLTRVRATTSNPKTFPTFTLPRALELR